MCGLGVSRATNLLSSFEVSGLRNLRNPSLLRSTVSSFTGGFLEPNSGFSMIRVGRSLRKPLRGRLFKILGLSFLPKSQHQSLHLNKILAIDSIRYNFHHRLRRYDVLLLCFDPMTHKSILTPGYASTPSQLHI